MDYDEAIKWTQLAADSDQPIALNNLGHIYENGFGVTADRDTAISYYQQAADQGYQLAAENLARLTGPATPSTGKTKTK
ncbi:Sel1 repeat protein [compost metagenome]